MQPVSKNAASSHAKICCLLFATMPPVTVSWNQRTIRFRFSRKAASASFRDFSASVHFKYVGSGMKYRDLHPMLMDKIDGSHRYYSMFHLRA